MKTAIPQIKVDWLLRYLIQRGLQWSAIISCIGLDKESKPESITYIPFVSYLRLLNWAAEALSRDSLGLELAEIVEPGDFGVLGTALHHFTTMREVFHALSRFHSLVSQGIAFRFEEGDTEAAVIFDVLLSGEEDLRQDIEFTLALVAVTYRKGLGEEHAPLRVNFRHERPANTCAHQQLFGSTVKFNQAVNSIIFSNTGLDTLIAGRDDDTTRRFTSQLEGLIDSVQREETILANTHFYINNTLGTGSCDADSVASLMYMSRRTLARHLANMGTSFRELKETLLIRAAKSLLDKRPNDLGQVALELGYSDVTAFSRAFKKLVGVAPGKYRDQLAQSAD